MIAILTPYIRTAVWGGTRLSACWNKPNGIISESVELSFDPSCPSEVPSGEPLYAVCPREGWGEACSRFPVFPTMIKLIDSAAPLSVQLHPDDALAARVEGTLGKTEMWYILDCEEGATLYIGLSRDITGRRLRNALNNGTILEYMNAVKVKKGESYLVPAGTLHCIGAGITLLEVQENSAVTYRVYDYGRPRELHTQKALGCVSLKKYGIPPQPAGETLARCEYFTVKRLFGSMTVWNEKSFTAIIATEREVRVNDLILKKGRTAFAEAGEKLNIIADGEFIAVSVE